MKLRIFGSGAVIYDAVDQIDPILVSSDFKSPNQTSQTRVLTQGDGGGPPAASAPRPAERRPARGQLRGCGAEPMAPRIQARAHRGLRRVRSRPALSVMSVTKSTQSIL